MDQAGMLTVIRRRLGEDSADFWTDADITRSIDNAIRQFNSEERWPWLQTLRTSDTLTGGTDTLSLPADIDFSQAFSIRLNIGSEEPFFPTRISTVEGERQRARHTVTGRPLYYYNVTTSQSAPGAGDETMTPVVIFVPNPDQNYLVRLLYRRVMAALSASTTEPDMPEKYQPAITAWATGELWEHELVGHEVKANEQFQKYAKVVADCRREMLRFDDDEEVVWGREVDEAELAGFDPYLPRYPSQYGYPVGPYGGY